MCTSVAKNASYINYGYTLRTKYLDEEMFQIGCKLAYAYKVSFEFNKQWVVFNRYELEVFIRIPES
jgi:hypothetical protein